MSFLTGRSITARRRARLPLALLAIAMILPRVATATDPPELLAFDRLDLDALDARRLFQDQFGELFDGEDGCVDASFAPSAALEEIVLGADDRLILFLCQPGAYNFEYVPFHVRRVDGTWRWTPVSASRCGVPANRIINPRWDERAEWLEFFEKGMGAGGCGTTGAMSWQEGSLTGAWCREWTDCDEPNLDVWPLIYGAPEAEYLPRAFSAEELRAGIEVGEHYVFQVDHPEGTAQTHMVFAAPDSDGVEVVSWEVVDEVAGEPVSARAHWAELADHSLYRRTDAIVSRATCATALGDMPGRQYDVFGSDGSVTHACFADELPGPPVRYSVTNGEAVVFGMVLIAHEIEPTVD